MMSLMRQMGGTFYLHDLLLIIAIALSFPLRLAFPLVAEIVSRRLNVRLTIHVSHSSTQPILVPL
jgi:hypothetical protein